MKGPIILIFICLVQSSLMLDVTGDPRLVSKTITDNLPQESHVVSTVYNLPFPEMSTRQQFAPVSLDGSETKFPEGEDSSVNAAKKILVESKISDYFIPTTENNRLSGEVDEPTTNIYILKDKNIDISPTETPITNVSSNTEEYLENTKGNSEKEQVISYVELPEPIKSSIESRNDFSKTKDVTSSPQTDTIIDFNTEGTLNPVTVFDEKLIMENDKLNNFTSSSVALESSSIDSRHTGTILLGDLAPTNISNTETTSNPVLQSAEELVISNDITDNFDPYSTTPQNSAFLTNQSDNILLMDSVLSRTEKTLFPVGQGESIMKNYTINNVTSVLPESSSSFTDQTGNIGTSDLEYNTVSYTETTFVPATEISEESVTKKYDVDNFIPFHVTEYEYISHYTGQTERTTAAKLNDEELKATLISEINTVTPIYEVSGSYSQIGKLSDSPLFENQTPLIPTLPSSNPTQITFINQTHSDSNSSIIRQENKINADGSFRNNFQTSNGIEVHAEGVLHTYNSTEKNGTSVKAINISGGYSYTAPNGLNVAITYTADENGYHPQGDVIPTPPPIPPQIAKALEWIRKVLEEKKEKERQQTKVKENINTQSQMAPQNRTLQL